MNIIMIGFLALSSLTAFAGNLSQRPDLSVAFLDVCVCENERSLSGASCENFCSDKKTNDEAILYAQLQANKSLSRSTLKNTEGWCKQPMSRETINPYCQLEIIDNRGGVEKLDVTIIGNELNANVSTLKKNEKLQLTLLERSSNLRSFSVKFMKLQ